MGVKTSGKREPLNFTEREELAEFPSLNQRNMRGHVQEGSQHDAREQTIVTYNDHSPITIITTISCHHCHDDDDGDDKFHYCHQDSP